MATIRRAAAFDAAALAAVLIAAREAAAGLIPPAVHSRPEIHRWAAEVLVEQRDTWVAEESGQVLGVLVLDGQWLDQLYVLPDSQGLGIGSALVAHAQAQRPQGLRLWVFQSNGPAIAFYQRHGFTISDSTDGSGNEERAPDHLMVWPGQP